MVSKITNKILPTIEEWQNRPLEKIYPNSMENFNRQLRKVTKSKAIFPNDFALSKSLYLAMIDASQKWTSRIRNWDLIRSQLSIFFEGRI